MSYVYLATSVLATALLIGFCALVKKKSIWLTQLYFSICIVNIGYYLLSIAKSLGFALFANRLAYFGSVFLCMFMLLTITELCGFKIKKKLYVPLFCLGALMYAVVFTQGFLPWYYRDVTLEITENGSSLVKVYGPLHVTYLIYLVLYFSSMIGVIVYSLVKDTSSTNRKHATFLASVVLANIAVWFIERYIPVDFEFLAVSYIMSELVLLCLYWIIQDYDIIRIGAREDDCKIGDSDEKTDTVAEICRHLPENSVLTEREREVLCMLLQNKRRKQIAEKLHISENTVKTHTAHIFDKFGVSGREDLISLADK